MVKKILTFGLGVAVIAGAIWYFQSNKTSEILLAPNAENQAAELSVASTTESAEARKTARILVATANYNCDGGKIIRAEFYQGEKIEVAAGQMPVPAGSLKLVLSDGRNLELAQTISADGGRYANGDESFVFWDKGGTALVLENGVEKDYTNCAMDQTEAAPQ